MSYQNLNKYIDIRELATMLRQLRHDIDEMCYKLDRGRPEYIHWAGGKESNDPYCCEEALKKALEHISQADRCAYTMLRDLIDEEQNPQTEGQ